MQRHHVCLDFSDDYLGVFGKRWEFVSYPYQSVCLLVSFCSLQWDNTKDGYYIAPAFMDKVVVHLAKNFMKLPNIKVSEIPQVAVLV